MSVFSKVTRKELKKNRTRTLVTIVGVILSAAMFTGVMTFISSLQNYFLQNVEQTSGSWHAADLFTTREDAQAYLEDGRVKDGVLIEDLGFVPLKDADDTGYPYLRIYGIDEQSQKMLPISLLQGRMPQNAQEIVISEELLGNRSIDCKVGDVLSLSIGLREYDGAILWDADPLRYDEDGNLMENLLPVQSRTYTIVGICKTPSYLMGRSVCYAAFTVPDQTAATVSAYVQVHDLDDAYLLNGAGLNEVNRDYLMASGKSNNDNYNSVVTGLAIVLSLLIIIGSISLIYNAFSISVSERTKELGLLASIGATRKQLYRSVMVEAFYIGIIGIPLGLASGVLGIGVTLSLIGDRFISLSSGSLPMHLHVSAPALLIAAGVSILTILLSAWLPARRAAHISPITAIRQSEDIRIRPRQVKTSRLTQLLFGLSGTLGAKNFKRNRKRYRATVFSLAMSIVLFVSANAFMEALTSPVENVVNVSNYDLSYICPAQELEETRTLLTTAQGVEKSSYYAVSFSDLSLDASLLTQKGRDYFAVSEQPGSADVSFGVIGLEDALFDQTARDLGVNTEQFYGDHAVGLWYGVAQGYDSAAQQFISVPITTSMPAAVQNGEFSITLAADASDAEVPFGLSSLLPASPGIILPYSQYEKWIESPDSVWMVFSAVNPTETYTEMQLLLRQNGKSATLLYNESATNESMASLVLVLKVFSYGFIALIALIAVTNVFNTISTSVMLRKREFAMLQSVGMTRGGVYRMLSYECLIYGLKALLYGIPLAILFCAGISYSLGQGGDFGFILPGFAIAISAVAVFIVVGITMVYAIRRAQRENLVDALKSEIF